MLLPAAVIRPSIVRHLMQAFPAWSPEGFICLDDLNRFRSAYIQSLLQEEKGELTSLERSVVESLARHETLAQDVEAQFQKSSRLASGLPTGSPISAAAGPSCCCSPA
jgi:hypothetical protein